MAHHLLEPLLETGIRNSHFFNGRILDADALKTEQQANRRQRAQLGQAIGEGIAFGLEVTIESKGSVTQTPVLKVREGLAINRRGQALELCVAPPPEECASGAASIGTDTISLALGEVTDPAMQEAGLFGICRVEDPKVSLLTGVSLLVLSPVSDFREHAPMKSLSVSGQDTGCGKRYAVEGVTFRLLGFPADSAGIGDLKTLRNRLAYRCYGVPEQLTGTNGQPSFPQNPFVFPNVYGALDVLRADGALTDCDVPLALLYQTNAGLQFCDMWAARRPLLLPAASEVWPLHIGLRRQSESMAMFLQFQEQLAELYQTAGNRTQAQAKEHFRYLPPAGYLPIKSGEFVASTFFTGLTTRRYTLDAAALRLLVATSWYLDPIDLTSNNPPTVRLYEAPGNAGYLLFLREESAAPIVVTTPEESGGTPPAVEKLGAIEVLVTLDREASLSEETVGRVKVKATDEDGREYAGVFKAHSIFDMVGKQKINTGRFVIASLPAGRYLVTLEASGFTTVSRQVTLAAGETKHLEITLTPKKRPDGKPTKPDRDFGGKWLDDHWYDKGFLLDKWFEWRYWEKILKWKPQPDPPPDIREQFKDWGEQFRGQYPDAPIDAGDIRILVDPEYTPDQIADDFYAVLQFGENGAYVPVALAAGDKTLDHSVSIDKGNLAGMDAGVIAVLKDAGINDLSMLTAVPTNVLAETLGVSMVAGQGIVSGAREAVDSLQNSTQQFDGVTVEVGQNLANAGIDSALALANSDLVTVTEAVGNEAFALRLLEQARGSVAAEFWSLDSPQYGLTGEEVSNLHDKGVFTLGQVAQRKEAGTADTLGLGESLIDALVDGFNALPAAITTNRVANTPVASLDTVGSKDAKALAESGFNTVDTLVTAKAEDLAVHLGGSAALAGRIIAEAIAFQNRGGIR